MNEQVGSFQNNNDGQTFCVRVMFDGFLADSAVIFKFKAAMGSSLGFKYDMDFRIFRPQEAGQQAIVLASMLKCDISSSGSFTSSYTWGGR